MEAGEQQQVVLLLGFTQPSRHPHLAQLARLHVEIVRKPVDHDAEQLAVLVEREVTGKRSRMVAPRLT